MQRAHRRKQRDDPVALTCGTRCGISCDMSLPRHSHGIGFGSARYARALYLGTFFAALVLLTPRGHGEGNQAAEGGAQPSGYSYGTKIQFGAAGNAAPFKKSGWSTAEEKFTWSEGTSAVLSMTVPPATGTVTLRVIMAGMIKEPEFPAQPIEVLVNDTKVANWQVGNTASFTAQIPQDLTKRGGALTIKFNIPKAASPKQLNKSEDPRVLGICVHELELSVS